MRTAFSHAGRCRTVVPLLVLLAIGQHQTSAVHGAESKPAAGSDAAAFIQMFEGDPAKHWIGYGKDKWPEGWEIVDGVLHRTGRGGDLQTIDVFGDFDLRFGWKVAPGANSGVMYRVVPGPGPAYLTGPEYQVLDNAKHRDGKSPLTSAAALYALYPPAKDVSKPAGKWNSARIVVRGNRVRHYLNGELVVEAEIGSDDWNKRLGAGKFGIAPNYAKAPRGHIVVQDHGDEVWLRNMRIKPLDGATASGESD